MTSSTILMIENVELRISKWFCNFGMNFAIRLTRIILLYVAR